jgi:hypothetical protein
MWRVGRRLESESAGTDNLGVAGDCADVDCYERDDEPDGDCEQRQCGCGCEVDGDVRQLSVRIV